MTTDTPTRRLAMLCLAGLCALMVLSAGSAQAVCEGAAPVFCSSGYEDSGSGSSCDGAYLGGSHATVCGGPGGVTWDAEV